MSEYEIPAEIREGANKAIDQLVYVAPELYRERSHRVMQAWLDIAAKEAFEAGWEAARS